jgi:predicted nucleic acid-binding protein
MASAAAGEAGLCRFPQLAIHRLLTNRAGMGEAVRTNTDAWQIVAGLLGDTRFEWHREPSGLDTRFAEYAPWPHSDPNRWQSAYLAAFAAAAGLELVTFDGGFTRFDGLRCRVLIAEASTLATS